MQLGICSRTKRIQPLRCGFSLVELLVVIAIIGVLMAMLMPAIQMVRESARRVNCTNNQRQLVLALQQYETANQRFPPAFRWSPTVHSWYAFILPHLEQQNLYESYDFDLNWYDPANQEAITNHVPLFQCPSTQVDKKRLDDLGISPPVFGATSDYATPYEVGQIVYDTGLADPVFDRRGLMADNEGARFKDVRDGASNTIAVTECAARPFFFISGKLGPENNDPGGGNHAVQNGRTIGGCWADPNNAIPLHGFAADGLSAPGELALNVTNNNEAYAFHPGGVVYANADGSVGFLAEAIDIGVYAARITRAGEEIIKVN